MGAPDQIRTSPLLIAVAMPEDPGAFATRQSSMSWGFDRLDKITAGIGNDLIVIGAAPGMGKSTFCNQLADSLAMQGHPVLVAALDQSLERYRISSAARLARVDSLDLWRGTCAAEESAKVVEASRLYNSRIHPHKRFVALHGADVTRLKAAVREFRDWKSEGGLLIVDALHNLRASTVRYTTRDSINDVLEVIRGIQHDFSIPIILIAHQSRSSGSNRYASGRDMGSLSDSNRIEYDTDVVILLDPAEQARRDDPEVSVRVRVEKNRSGPKGEIGLRFLKPFALFEEWALPPPAECTNNDAYVTVVGSLPGPGSAGIKAAEVAKATGLHRKEVNGILKDARGRGDAEAVAGNGAVVPPDASVAGKTLFYRKSRSTSLPPDLP